IGTQRAGVPVGRNVAAGQEHVDREAGASQRCRGQLPVACNGARYAVAEHVLAAAEGKLVDGVAVDYMAGVPCAARPRTGGARWVLRRDLVAVTAAVGDRK